MSTSSRVLALGEKNAFYQKVFLRSHFSLMILLVFGTRRICLRWRKIPFLVFDMCGSTVFLKTELFFLVRAVSFQKTHPTLLPRAQCILLLRIVLCFFVDFNKRLEVIPRIGPIAVSCHSSSVWFLVSLLLPLLFLLRSSSDRLQVLDLCSSTKLRIAKEGQVHSSTVHGNKTGQLLTC